MNATVNWTIEPYTQSSQKKSLFPEQETIYSKLFFAVRKTSRKFRVYAKAEHPRRMILAFNSLPSVSQFAHLPTFISTFAPDTLLPLYSQQNLSTCNLNLLQTNCFHFCFNLFCTSGSLIFSLPKIRSYLTSPLKAMA